MNEGDPLSDDDVWLRNIMISDHIRSDGKIADAAFRIDAARAGRAWQHEVSGRCRSECGDVNEEGRAFEKTIRDAKAAEGKSVGKKFGYNGVAEAKVSELRGNVSPDIRSDLFFTPTADKAHSDFATFGSTVDTFDEIRHYLQKRVTVRRAVAPNTSSGPGVTTITSA